MKQQLTALLASGIVLGFLSIPGVCFSAPATPVPSKATPTPVPTRASSPPVSSAAAPAPRAAVPPVASSFYANPGHTLLLHKPLIPSEWGQVIQYHRETITTNSLFNSEKETIHEFTLQSTDGIIRTAFYHEPETEGAYWVVWVWDQP